QYWTTEGALPASADEWLAQAQRRDGSWWPEWNRWIEQFGGGKVPARVPGTGKLSVIEDAPGAYAKLRLDAKDQGEVPPAREPAAVRQAANDAAVQPAASPPVPASATPSPEAPPTPLRPG